MASFVFRCCSMMSATNWESTGRLCSAGFVSVAAEAKQKLQGGRKGPIGMETGMGVAWGGGGGDRASGRATPPKGLRDGHLPLVEELRSGLPIASDVVWQGERGRGIEVGVGSPWHGHRSWCSSLVPVT